MILKVRADPKTHFQISDLPFEGDLNARSKPKGSGSVVYFWSNEVANLIKEFDYLPNIREQQIDKMNMTKLPIRKRIGNVLQFPVGVDAAVVEVGTTNGLAKSSLEYMTMFMEMTRATPLQMSLLESLASSVVLTANKSHAKLIVVLTNGGTTSKVVAKGLIPFLAVGTSKATDTESTDVILQAALMSATKKELCKPGYAIVALHHIGSASVIKIILVK
ncbi:hypothetical protein AgCh_036220 [Apium graveolens]